jgi:hypothetical protein
MEALMGGKKRNGPPKPAVWFCHSVIERYDLSAKSCSVDFFVHSALVGSTK